MTVGENGGDTAMTLSSYDVLLKAEVLMTTTTRSLPSLSESMDEPDSIAAYPHSLTFSSVAQMQPPTKNLREYFANPSTSSSSFPMHVGNNRFRVMLDEKRPTFLKSWAMEDWKECEEIVCRILDTICADCNPPGRLLVQQHHHHHHQQQHQRGGSSSSDPWQDLGQGPQAQRIVAWLMRAEEDGIAIAPSKSHQKSVPSRLGRDDNFTVEEEEEEASLPADGDHLRRSRAPRRRSSAFSFIRFLARRNSSERRSSLFSGSSLRFSGMSSGLSSFRTSTIREDGVNFDGARDSLKSAAMAVASLEELREQEEGLPSSNGLGASESIAEDEVTPISSASTTAQQQQEQLQQQEEERKRRRSSSHSINLGKALRRGSVQLPAVRTESINPLDIICTTDPNGSGFVVDMDASYQQGNNRLQISINMNRARYESSEQTQVVSEIFSLVKSWPGRFVYQDANTGGKWRELPRKEAVQALHASMKPPSPPAVPEGPPPSRKTKTAPPPPPPIVMPVNIPTTFSAPGGGGRGSDVSKLRSAEVRNLKEQKRKKEIASRINRGRSNFGAVQQMFRLKKPAATTTNTPSLPNLLQPAKLKRGSTN